MVRYGIFANAVEAPLITKCAISTQNPLSVPNTSVGIAINGWASTNDTRWWLFL
ncbi:MAG: hypothetical protein IPK08_08015 [Bacteroidetes bacterium]|nr:hypothetical protein [Bacteroidota bacterium]